MISSSEEKQALLVSMFSNVGHAFAHMFTLLYATAVLYLPKVFEMTYGELLSLSSFGLILFGVCALPAGWLGDRWSQIGMMIAYFLGIGVGTIIIGSANEPLVLFAGLTILGLFGSIYHPVGIAWLVSWAKKQGMTLGINNLFGNIGAAMAPIFVGLMIDYATWRAAFVIPGILSILAGLALWLAWRTGRIRDITQDRVATESPDSRAFLRVFVLLTITMACSGFVYSGVTTTMPKLFEMGLNSALAASYTEIGVFVGLISGFASLSSILGGWLADRFSPRLIYLVFWLLQIPVLLIVVSLSNIALLTSILLLLCIMVSFAAAENMLVAQYTPFRWRAVGYGAKFVLALGFGGVTVHLAGILFDRDGDFASLFVLLGGAAVLAALATFFLPSNRLHDLAEEAG